MRNEGEANDESERLLVDDSAKKGRRVCNYTSHKLLFAGSQESPVGKNATQRHMRLAVGQQMILAIGFAVTAVALCVVAGEREEKALPASLPTVSLVESIEAHAIAAGHWIGKHNETPRRAAEGVSDEPKKDTQETPEHTADDGHGAEHDSSDTHGDEHGHSDGHEDEHGHEHGYSDAHGDEHGHAHPYHTMIFLIGGLCVGSLIQVAQERYLSAIPYTSILFLVGVLFSFIHNAKIVQWQAWYISIEVWEHIDSHLFLYLFLPALIFSEAMRLNMTLARNISGQVFLLACPGVIAGTVATATFVKYCFTDYNWDWTTSLTFGSILAATDPVAVVALFNTLGVSQRLTMLISGESLINDGTAIVLFKILFMLMHPNRNFDFNALNGFSLPVFILRMTGFAIVTGTVLAWISLIIIGWCSETMHHTDAMIQVVVAVACAYFSFIAAEDPAFQASGVIAVVTAGSVFSYYGWPRFASRETMHTVWEAVEFIGNTLVFLLAGLLFGHRCLQHQEDLSLNDIWWLLALYAAVMLIRLAMILLFMPFLNCLGTKVSWQEVIVMAWSGLRGAVGLALAIEVDQEAIAGEVPTKDGSRFMFHIGGIAMLTLIFNATLAAPLLRALGLTKSPDMELRVIEHLKDEIDAKVKETFGKQKGAKDIEHLVAHAVPAVESVKSGISGESELSPHKLPATHREHLRVARELFIRMVQAEYWQEIEGGLLPRTSRVARVMIQSADEVLLNANAGIQADEWAAVQSGMSHGTTIGRYLGCVCESRLFRWAGATEIFPTAEHVRFNRIFAAMSLIRCYDIAMKKFMESHASQTFAKVVLEELQKSCAKEVNEAKQFLEEMDAEDIKKCQTRREAGELLKGQLCKVNEMYEEGLVSDKSLAHIAHKLHVAYRSVPLLDSTA